jgi:hypothetical protein
MAKRDIDATPELEAETVKALPEPAAPARPARSGTTVGQRVARFFRFLLRLVLLMLLFGALILGLYFGLPLLYRRYVAPVERNTADVVQLQSRLEQAEQELADLQTKLGTIETEQRRHDQSLSDLDERVVDVETAISARTESLAALEKMQSELQEQNEVVSTEMERQIDLLKSMELLSRARLFLYESNFGLARQDVQIARSLLAARQPDAPEELAAELDEVILRLDMTLSKLPNFPVAASDDLDIAWLILVSGLPESTPAVTLTPSPAGAASPTPGAADMTITPTLQATARPSATP